MPCGHLAVCVDCFTQFSVKNNKNNKCLICRNNMDAIYKVSRKFNVKGNHFWSLFKLIYSQ